MPKGFCARFDWENWLYGLFSGVISGGAGAVTSGLVVSFKDPKDYNLATSNFWQLVLTIFMVQGVLTGLAFLHNRPLPNIVTTTTVETTKKKSHPTATITTKVETTEVKQKKPNA